MSTYQKIRKMVTDMKKHSLIHHLKRVNEDPQTTLRKKDHSTIESQANLTLFPLLTLTDENNKNNQNIGEGQKMKSVQLMTPKTEQKKEIRKRKTFNSLSFRVTQKGKSEYCDTLHNVSSMLTNPIGTKIRVNNSLDKSAKGTFYAKSHTNRVISFTDATSAPNHTVMEEKLI